MPHSLPAIIAHVRTQNRPASYGGMLLAEIDRMNDHARVLNLILDGVNRVVDVLGDEIDRLTAAVADLTDARDHLMAMRAVEAGEMGTLTDAELEAYLKETTDV